MRSRRVVLALCVALLAATSLVPGAVAVTDAGGGATTDAGDDATTLISPSMSVTAQTPIAVPGVAAASQGSNATVTLNRSIVTVRSGEAATIELVFQDTDEATIVVGGDGAGDNVTATVTDGNGDGVVRLEFETGLIGTMRTRFVPVDDGDDYGTVNASEFGGPLPAGEYPISVYVGHGISGEPTDLGTLVVNGTTTPEPTTEPPEDTTPETTTEPTTAQTDAFIDLSGEAVTLHPRSDQVVAGSTSLDARREVTVRLRSSGDSPFLLSAQADVGDDGAFAVSFDLSDVEAPANATVVVTVDGDRVAGPVDVAVVEEQEGTSQPVTSSPGQAGFGVGVAVVGVILAIALGRWDL